MSLCNLRFPIKSHRPMPRNGQSLARTLRSNRRFSPKRITNIVWRGRPRIRRSGRLGRNWNEKKRTQPASKPCPLRRLPMLKLRLMKLRRVAKTIHAIPLTRSNVKPPLILTWVGCRSRVIPPYPDCITLKYAITLNNKMLAECYLVSFKATAGHSLGSGDWRTDFNQANALLVECQSTPGLYGTRVGARCETQEHSNISWETNWDMGN